jgi:hypothetical protein
MNYDNHLSQFREKEDENEKNRLSEETAKEEAEKQSYREAEKLVKNIIEVELALLQQSLERANYKAKLKTSKVRHRVETYEVEIVVSVDGESTRYIKYEAIPSSRVFNVEYSSSNPGMPRHSRVLYSEVTRESVAEDCEKFLKASFPL